MRPPRGTPKGPLPIQDQICLLKSVLRHDPFNCPIRRTSQVWEIIGREQGIRARTCARRYDNIIQASISGRQFQTGGNSGIVGGNATGAAAAVKGTEEQIATKNSLLEQLFTMMNQPQALIRMQKKKRYRSEDADRRLLKEIIRLNPFGQRVGQVAKAWEDVRDALGMKVHSRQCIRRVNRMIKPYQVRDRMYSGKIPEAMREENDDLIKEVIELMKLAGQQGEGEEEEGEEEGGGEEEDDGGSGNGGQDEEDDSMTGSASEYDDQEEGSVHTQSPPTVHRFEEKVEDRRVQHIKSDDSAAHLHSPKVNQLREDLSPQTWTSPQQTPDDNFKSRHSPPHTSEPIQQTSSAPRLPRLPILSHLRDTLEQSKRSSDSHHPYARVTRSQDWSSPRHRIVLPSPTSRQDKVDDHREGTRSSIASTTSADHPLWTQTQWSYPASERNPDDCLDRILLEIRTIHTSLGRMESQQQRDRDHRRSINMTILQFRDQLDQQQQQIQAMQRQLQSSQPYSHPDLGLRHPLDYNPHLKRFHREDDSSNFSSVSHEGPYRDQSS
ncbi:hypothetical protein BGZ83_007124 [Gryganskiella cystojenkinii]|nr:hypothetical protein BGZ83_007124 [Gryganskiella cystojenkinii]